MKTGKTAAVPLLLTFLCPSLRAQTPPQPTHVRGPHNLEGWKRETVVETLEDQGPLPVELIVARGGHVLRRIKGDPFLWTWTFQSDGQRVAYETGPLHFSMTCVLMDISTGRRIEQYDCFHDPLPSGAPAWVRQLESKAISRDTASLPK